MAIEREVNAQLGGTAPNPEIEIGWFEEDVITRFAGTGIQYALIDISSDHSVGAAPYVHRLSARLRVPTYCQGQEGCR